ncbi:hypothetical protein DMB66_21840 [Actinoplanes sp. ATCC 53533]|uniref:hypothetical protein n=1 Tax=Actinoplanes sp. ATCC 53533 TaxID=1288362 RepID=UPI000F7699F6|nr:hypothetical protein [Actinoplanes sp. ATCC 53533]RSM63975.1 hypothetical protein DMB66_21840 [Actinoplanes sp. ATCC 53533]
MSSDVLEKRYRMLLRAYPAEYRRERADELIDTLLGDEPTTRRWPTLRQAASLIRGALRVYGGSTAARPTAVLLWQGIHLGAMAVLALGALIGLDDLVEAFQFGGFSDPLAVLRDQGIHEVMVGAALVALVAGRARTAAVLTVAAAVVPTAFSTYLFSNGLPQWWAPVVAAPLIVVGLWRPADVSPAPRANAVLVTAGMVALHLIPVEGFRNVDMSSRILAAAMVTCGAAAFLWVAAADQRLLVAVIPTFLLGTLHQLDILYSLLRAGQLDDTSVSELWHRPDALPSLVVAVLVTAGTVVSTRLRQRTRA